MNSESGQRFLADVAQVVWGFSARLRADLPQSPVLRMDAGGVGSLALCVTTGPRHDGDGLDPLIYCVGSGLSWKPMAAAFRVKTFNILAFILASYSSIDWVTYSWPYLSIL
jgi:hypothetical protein